MAGKTGTSQVRRISRSERLTGLRKNEEKPWEERDHALFVAFAPYDEPRYALAVVVEHGGSGSTHGRADRARHHGQGARARSEPAAARAQRRRTPRRRRPGDLA